MDNVFKWREVVMMVRGIAQGPNYLVFSVDHNPVNDDVCNQLFASYYDTTEYWSGVSLFETQNKEYVLRRFFWPIQEDHKIYQSHNTEDGRSVIRNSLKVRTEYWASGPSVMPKIDRLVEEVKDTLLSRAIAFEAGEDGEAECNSGQTSAYSWARIKFGTGRLVQDGVSLSVYEGAYRGLESLCSSKFGRMIDLATVRESYNCEPVIGSAAEYSALELTQLPHSLCN